MRRQGQASVIVAVVKSQPWTVVNVAIAVIVDAVPVDLAWVCPNIRRRDQGWLIATRI